MACHDEIILYMHEYLDGGISDEHEQMLKNHLQACPDCQTHFQELKRTCAFIKSTSHIKASPGFTENVMDRLPKQKGTAPFKRWMRHHPLLSAVALFMILMAGSVFGIWQEDQKFSFTKQPNLIVQNDTVIVPEGEVVKGDIIVKNGNVRIEGEVQGHVTIINGKKYMASAGNVTGDVEEINQVFQWLWFKIKEGAKGVVGFLDDNEKSS